MRHHTRRLICAAILCGLAGCGGYGEISPAGYDYAKALYSICNREDESRLETFSSMLEEARRTGELTATEADWLADIVSTARRGEWEAATSASRRMLMDQVE
jgi:hypothetical protein